MKTFITLLMVLFIASIGYAANIETYTMTQDLAFDQGTLTIDADGNNIGVGTTTPTKKLDVTGDAAVSGNLSVDSVTTRTATFGSTGSVGYINAGAGILHLDGNLSLDGSLSISNVASPSGAVKILVYNTATKSVGRSALNFPVGSGSGTVASGISGRVAYYNATGTAVDDLSVLYYDATNLHMSKPVSLSDSLSVKGNMWVNSNNIAVANGIQQANSSGVPITTGTVNLLGNLSESGTLTANGVMYATKTLKPSAGLTISNTLSGSGATVWYALVIDSNGNVKRSATAWNR